MRSWLAVWLCAGRLAWLCTTPIVAAAWQPAERTTKGNRREALHWIASTGWSASASTAALLYRPASVNAIELPSSNSPLVPGGVALYRPQGIGSWPDSPSPVTKLGASRLAASQLSPLQQPLFGETELYYAPFLFGAWNVTAKLQRKIYPYSVNYLPSSSLLEGSPRNREELVGNLCDYEVHYFSTTPASKIIQDRAFNAVSISKAYQQLTPVQEVLWDYRQAPDKVVLDFGSGLLTDDLRPLGPRRAEIFLNARATETGADGRSFCAVERARSVTVAARKVIVAETETTTEFRQVSDDEVTAVSRIAVYLSPNPNSREGVMWQQVGGKAVAFFDYKINLRRIKEEVILADGTSQTRACVPTPNDEVQCA
jgi:hypothetical protein